MPTLKEVLTGTAQAMEDSVPDLTVALPREADEADNTVRWPHGEIVIVSNVRADQWNTDFVGYSTDSNDNRVGYIYDAKFDLELQLNIWIAAPSDDWDIQALGSQLERGLRRYEDARHYPDPLPDGSGGSLTNTEPITIVNGGELPTESQNPPHRGYQVTIAFSFNDRIDTSEEYGEMDYVAEVDHPGYGDLTDGDHENVAIEYTIV